MSTFTGRALGQRELQERGVEALLVDGQPVLRLGLAGAGEQLSGVRGVLDAEEDPRGLLVEDGQEVRDGGAEPFCHLQAGVERGLRLGLGLPGGPVEFGDEGERVVPVHRVVHQHPLGEPEGPALPEADHGRFAVLGHEAQEPGGEVLGRAEFGGGEPHDDAALVEGGVPVGPRGQVDGPGARVRGARREHRARLEQQFGLAHGPPLGVLGRGVHAFPPSSIVRPAYSAAAIRIPSDQATGPTSVSRTA